MIVLILIGFLGGLVTGISPCILPVLPVVFAAGAASGLVDESREPGPSIAGGGQPSAAAAGSQPGPGSTNSTGVAGPDGVGSVGVATSTAIRAVGEDAVPDRPARSGPPIDRRRRPFAVVGGLVLSFSVVTLVGSWILDALGLPLDALRWIGLIVLGLVGLGLVIPAVGALLEVPFVRLGRGRHRSDGGGFVLGLSLGLVFVPCAGPVLAAITVVGATHRLGAGAIILTVAFALGAAVPLLIFALLGQGLAGRMRLLRSRVALVRRAVGVVLLLTALVLALNLTDGLQREVPGYTDALQQHIEGNASATRALAGVTGNSTDGGLASCSDANPTLQECGPAPPIQGITTWLNTPGHKPLSIAGLRGRVVLLDFWTYSCINCQRTLPHVEAWNRAYGSDGLTVIGVHTPEFAFEHVPSNVVAAAEQLGVRYPVAIDDDYATWDAYENEDWPAEYLIDATGHIRHVDFGEGNYGRTESLIRQLLVAADPTVHLPRPTDIADLTPTEPTTPESYLGFRQETALADQTVHDDQMTPYVPPGMVPPDDYAYGGQWSVGAEEATAGAGATLTLNFEAKDVYLVLGGTGTVGVTVNGVRTRMVAVGGEPKLYQLVGDGPYQQALLTLTVSPGVEAYDFTFG